MVFTLKRFLRIAGASLGAWPAVVPPAEGGAPTGATARLTPTAGSDVSGSVTFAPVAGGGVRITGEVKGLRPGSTHGFHVHEHGDCSSPDGMSAGGHFNPDGEPHGPQGGPHHAGDLPNLVADPDGVARFAVDSSRLALSGPNSVIGRALIVHAAADDFTSQPAGNSGARLACGVIAANR